MKGATDKLTHRVDEACDVVGVSRATIYRWIGEGTTLTLKAGRMRLVRADSLKAYLASLDAAA